MQGGASIRPRDACRCRPSELVGLDLLSGRTTPNRAVRRVDLVSMFVRSTDASILTNCAVLGIIPDLHSLLRAWGHL